MFKMFDWLYKKFSTFIVEILEKWGIKKAQVWAARLLVLTALLTAFVAFQQVIQLAIVGLIHIPSSPYIQTAAWVVLPDAAPSCLSALITARVAQFGFQWLAWKYKELSGNLPIL